MERLNDVLSSLTIKGKNLSNYLSEYSVENFNLNISSNGTESTELSNRVFNKKQIREIWEKATEVLGHKLDNQIFSAWIKPISISELEIKGVPQDCQQIILNSVSFKAIDSVRGNGKTVQALKEKQKHVNGDCLEVTISAPNKFCCEHVRQNYGELISGILSEMLGTNDAKLRFKVCVPSPVSNRTSVLPSKLKGISSARIIRPSGLKQNKASSGLDLETNLNPKYNFSNFVVGDCNQLSHAIALQVSENIGTKFNPLFLYGGVGLGKTHLANAIGNSARRRGKKVLLVSSEIFVSELIASLRNHKMDQFKSKFRSLDLLIIDDIQFLIGKERTLEEFFHTFNDLHQRQKQIVITSDQLPQDLVGLEERLKTRFSSGISVDLQCPDFETRVAILTKKAEISGFSLPIDVAQLLAERISTNVRELEGALNRLYAVSSVQNEEISVRLAESVLDSVVPKKTVTVTSDRIQEIVARRYSIGVSDLLGKRRTQNIAYARQVAMYLCRELTSSSFPEIGGLFGGRDHSTVIHAKRVIESKMKQNKEVECQINSLISEVKTA